MLQTVTHRFDVERKYESHLLRGLVCSFFPINRMGQTATYKNTELGGPAERRETLD
jgi:hypothetical protein